MSTINKRVSRILSKHRRAVRRIVLGAVIVHAMVLAFILRFEFVVPVEKMPLLLYGILLALAVKLPIFFFRGLDSGGWHYVEFSDLSAQVVGNGLASAAFTVTTYLVVGTSFPRSIYCIDFLICLLTTSGVLFVIRLCNEASSDVRSEDSAKNVLIYGAGNAGRTLIREIQTRRSIGYRVLGFLDDDPAKRGMRMFGVRVLGAGRKAASIVTKFSRKGTPVEEIIIAIPSATSRQMGDALANCRAARVNCKTVPSLSELITGRVVSSQIRDVSCNDLLGREPVRLDQARIRASICGRCVMVTGSGGSIGSELCRQIAKFGPAKLVVFDQAESDLYRIHRELKETFPGLCVIPQIGSIRSPQRLLETIRPHFVDSIFHAAAYKHVPMMEAHPLEAIENNVLGTHYLLEASLSCRVSSFVMISSDKAVNPTNLMGLTKRIAELLVASMPARKNGVGSKFVSVRFGNVLGSNGSVVPLFRSQIEAGGPVTVTHPEMRRYFMTIPEAVQLVLEASPLGEGSELFVLDMGEPVRIVDLARNMIRLSGRDPAEIDIQFTGLRPGEKLFEELHLSGENMLPTHHPKIRMFVGPAPSREVMLKWVDTLKRLAESRDELAVIRHMAELVPDYTPSKEWEHAFTVRRSLVTAG